MPVTLKIGKIRSVVDALGNETAYTYDELNHLSEINDWLGKTTLENDIFGRLSKVTDYQNRTVAYEYNALGAKTGLTYPDGRRDLYDYDEEGNIIQPFAFTGYQEDKVSGLMFAQARHYDATSGRFQSEDRVKGFKNSPFTLNHYSYCFGNPVGFVDRNGQWFDWAADAWDAACDDWDLLCDFLIDASGYDEAAARYQKECEKNSSGKSLEELQQEYTEELPDYTEAIDAWLEEQEQYFDEIYADIDTAGPEVVEAIAELYYQFYEHVKTGGSMDVKQSSSWDEAFSEYGIPYPGEGGLFIYHGQVMDPATLGNVTYAYIGSKYFTEFEIFSGGAAVQVKRYWWPDLIYMYFLPYWGDMDEDHEAIELGIKWRKEGFPCDG